MSLLMNMKIDGITGDSRSFKHKGWFEVLSWNWGMISNRKAAQFAESDKMTLNELSVIKNIGSDSAGIRSLFVRGDIIPGIDFNIMPAVGKREAQTKYIDIRIEDVIIKSIVTGGSNEDKLFKEHITFIFDRVKFSYSLDTVGGAETEDGVAENEDFGWNVSDSVEWR